MRKDIRETFDLLANILVVACLLIALGVYFLGDHEEVPPPAPTEVYANWRDIEAVGRTIGLSTAPIHVIGFGDYQCPACKLLDRSMDAAKRRFGDSLVITYVHFPLEYHSAAMPAARAVDCAFNQSAFIAMHRQLFALQDSLGFMPFNEFARRAEVNDLEEFSRCMDSANSPFSIDLGRRAATLLGITGTPTLLINGRVIRGSPTISSLFEILVNASNSR